MLIIFLLLSAVAGYAQSEVTALRWQVEFKELSRKNFEATAVLSLGSDSLNVLKLAFHPREIHSVKLREGRLKQELSFRQSNNQLLIYFRNVQLHPQSQIEISYTVDLDVRYLASQWFTGLEFWALGTSNIRESPKPTPRGLWFPEPQFGQYQLQLDVLMPRQWEIRHPYREDFTVRSEQKRGVFITAEGPFSSEGFYLAFGDLEGKSITELDRRYGLTAQTRREQKLQTARMQLKDAIRYLADHHQKVFSEAQLLKILEMRDPAEYPLSKALQMAGIETDSRHYRAFFMQFEDSLRAQVSYWDFATAGRDSSASRVLGRLWKPDSLSPLVTSLYLRNYQAEVDGYGVDSLSRAAENLIQQIQDSLQIYRLRLRYRYLASADKFMIEAASENEFTMPALFRIRLRDTTFLSPQILRVPDTLQLPLDQSPYSVNAVFWNAPVEISEEKPEMYYLSDLRYSNSTRQKRAALEELLKTQNINLLATVIGIALDFPEVGIRRKALQEVTRLNSTGRQRVQNALRDVAENDASEELRKRARSYLESE